MLLTPCLQYVRGSDTEQQSASSKAENEDTPSDAKALPPQYSPEDLDPLFLTPYIKNCTYELARNKSKVQLFQQVAGVNAYSGYITVNSTADIHLFFLFVEAEGNSSNAPLLLWTQGGPGLSALFGEFLQNGPVGFNGTLYPRLNTLQKNMSIIYLDLPVGAGFSFTRYNTSYPRYLEEITITVQEFLTQFLEMFSYYNMRDFYLAGESYGARYSVAIAHWMLTNQNNLPLTLKGVIGGNGFLGPVLEVADSSDFLYQMSMVDVNGRQQFAERFAQMRQLAQSGDYNKTLYALKLFSETIFTDTQTPTMFQNLTLYNDHASPMYTERPYWMLQCFFFLSMNTTKIALHAGVNNTFQINNPLLLFSFASDWLRDISLYNEHVLNQTSVLLYTGQMDALFPSVNQRNYFKRLNWTYADEYRNVSRYPWTPYKHYYGFAGYIKTVQRFSEAVLLGMSHYGAAEKPDEVYFLMMQFIANSSKLTGAAAIAQNTED